MRRGRGPSYGQSIYPSPSAKKEGRIGVTPFMRCVQCGLPNDTRKVSWSETGEGLSEAVDVTVTPVTGQTQAEANTKERNVLSGCRFCGSLKWRETKVKALPDDIDKPSSEFYRKIGRR